MAEQTLARLVYRYEVHTKKLWNNLKNRMHDENSTT